MGPTIRLHAVVHGNGRTPWLVFLHGFLGDGHDWDGITDALLPRYSCLCVELPGHGRSRIDEPCRATEVVDGLDALLDEHQIGCCALLGYSMGGRVALSLAAHRPARIERLILESTSRGIRLPDERETRRVSDAKWIALLENKGMGAFVERWYEQPLFETIRRVPARFEELAERRSEQEPRQLSFALQSMGAGVWPDAWAVWPTLAMPVLLIAGACDTRYAALAREMQTLRPATEVCVVPSCGHNVHWEDPAAYTAAVAGFLKDG